jgi:enoyl-[acyl-carrier-protein] reductase (NADH)
VRVRRHSANGNPAEVRRPATHADVGNAAAFAASDWARSLTAATINISAGAIVDP